MIGKITTRLMEVVTQLIRDGYQGEVKITNTGCSGTADILQGAFALELTGFCKETLYLVDDEETQRFIFIGRYSAEGIYAYEQVDTEYLTRIAWSFYKIYKGRGYSRPTEWENLFEKFGLITKKEVTRTEIEEAD